MQRHITALRAVFYRNVLILRRYAFNTVSSLVTMYIMFMVMFQGAKNLGGQAINSGDTLEAMIIGYLLWMMAIMAYSELSWDLHNQAQVGTLEQLYVSPIGFKWLNIYNLLTNLLLQFVYAGVMLGAIIATTGKKLNVDVVSIVPIFFLALLAAYGIGFIMGGLALIYKRIQSFFQILQFVFIAFLTLPWSKFPWAKYLPLSMGSALLKDVMVHGQRLWELPTSDLLVLVGTGLFYLLVGIGVFAYAEHVAKEKGLLGHY